MMWKVFNQYQMTAFALYRSAGTVPAGSLFKVVLNDPALSGFTNGHNRAMGVVFLDNAANWWKRKFLAIHEVGHRYALLTTGDSMGLGQYYYNFDALCPADVPVDSEWDHADQNGLEDPPPPHFSIHGIRSLEYVGSALGEGFSHFYAANAWNDTSDDDCWFRYYIGVVCPLGQCIKVDCESENGVFLRRLMHTRACSLPCPDGYFGYGDELDWLRAFWDLRTNSHPNGSPSLAVIVGWLADASAVGWDHETAYDILNEQAQLEAANLRDLWNSTRESSDDPLCNADCNGLEPELPVVP
ncbi:MAG: hypothetical protein HY996_00205 [Micrococcales bacterium]|nr:hypothetical protein [Micrococcales bacterium]